MNEFDAEKTKANCKRRSRRFSWWILAAVLSVIVVTDLSVTAPMVKAEGYVLAHYPPSPRAQWWRRRHLRNRPKHYYGLSKNDSGSGNSNSQNSDQTPPTATSRHAVKRQSYFAE